MIAQKWLGREQSYIGITLGGCWTWEDQHCNIFQAADCAVSIKQNLALIQRPCVHLGQS